VPWATLLYKSRKKSQEPLLRRLREMAATHVRYGYCRLTVLLRREGWKVSAKRVYRLYDEENLKVRSVERKKIAGRQRVPQARALGPNHCWSADFVSDELADGRNIRILTVIDQFTRECVRLEADRSMNGPKVVTALTRAVTERAATPNSITLDNVAASSLAVRWKPGRSKPVYSSASSAREGLSRTGSSRVSMADFATNASMSSDSRPWRRRKQNSPNGATTTITCDLTVRSMIGPRRSLPNCTENRHSASPCFHPLRQTAHRLKGSLCRLTPPLTRLAVCPKISIIKAKRFYASLKLEAFS
jgi:HTH-like domain/Integrase core domain